LGPVGPGIALQSALAPDAEVVATVYCGDNYIAEQSAVALDRVVDLIKAQSPGAVVLGPAFASGRYGLACGSVARAVREQLGLPVITGLHEGNPAVDMYRQWALIVPTRDSAAGIREAIGAMAALTRKIARGEDLGPAEAEGYLPTGRRVNSLMVERGARRAANMLLNRLRDAPTTTEWELPHYDPVTPAPAVRNLASATVALVSEAGCVPRGNPDRIKSSWATTWKGYSVAGRAGLPAGEWEYIHGGYDTTFVNDDPNRGIPLDAMRRLEQEGRFARLFPDIMSTCGSMASLSASARFGQEIASALHRAGVQACILTAT
jgi:glycine reductase